MGAVTATTSGSYYTGTCGAVACPSNSNGNSVPSGCSCNTGFYGTIAVSISHPFFVGTCSQNSCTCDHGQAATGTSCTLHQASICSGCNTGYHLSASSCTINSCSCSGGTAATGSSCTTDGAAICTGCSGGYHLSGSSCASNVCTCSGGTAATGASCTTNGVTQCAGCSAGYHLSSNACSQNSCSCTGGTAAIGSSCTTDGVNICTVCSTGFHLSGSSCVSNSCTCSGGTAASGTSCTTNGATICIGCLTGYQLSGNACSQIATVSTAPRLLTAAEIAAANCTKDPSYTGALTFSNSNGQLGFDDIPDDAANSARWWCDFRVEGVTFDHVGVSYTLIALDPVTGSSTHADDNAVMSAWGEDATSHNGYFSMGTPSTIINGGLSKGGNVATGTVFSFPVGSTSRTDTVRLGFCQSYSAEDFSINNIQINISGLAAS